MNVEQFISTLPLIFVGLAAGVSLVSFCYNYPVTLKQLSILWVLNFCIDLTGHITRHFKIENHWVYNIYFWILYLSLAYLYAHKIENSYVRGAIRVFYAAF